MMFVGIIFMVVGVGCAGVSFWAGFRGFRTAPDARDRNRSGIGFVAEQSGIVMKAALLVHVRLNDLRSNARGKIAMFALLDQHGDHDFRIAPGSDTGEPAIVLKLLAASTLALAQRIADDLGAARLSGKINSLQVGAVGRSYRTDYAGHSVCNGDPVLRIQRDMGSRIASAGRLLKWRSQLIRSHNMGAVKRPGHGDSPDGVRQLNGGSRYRSLANAHGDGFTGIPFL